MNISLPALARGQWVTGIVNEIGYLHCFNRGRRHMADGVDGISMKIGAKTFLRMRTTDPLAMTTGYSSGFAEPEQAPTADTGRFSRRALATLEQLRTSHFGRYGSLMWTPDGWEFWFAGFNDEGCVWADTSSGATAFDAAGRLYARVVPGVRP